MSAQCETTANSLSLDYHKDWNQENGSLSNTSFLFNLGKNQSRQFMKHYVPNYFYKLTTSPFCEIVQRKWYQSFRLPLGKIVDKHVF